MRGHGVTLACRVHMHIFRAGDRVNWREQGASIGARACTDFNPTMKRQVGLPTDAKEPLSSCVPERVYMYNSYGVPA